MKKKYPKSDQIKNLIPVINDALFNYYKDTKIRVEIDEMREDPIMIVFDSALREYDRAKGAAFIFCLFPEIESIGYGGVRFTRETLLSYAYALSLNKRRLRGSSDLLKSAKK